MNDCVMITGSALPINPRTVFIDNRLQSTLRAAAPALTARARRSAAMDQVEQAQPSIEHANAVQVSAAVAARAPHKRGNLDAHEPVIPDDFKAPLIEA
jgi:hypothetical protein